MDKTTLKQIIKEFQEFRFPEIYPREIEIPLDSKKLQAFLAQDEAGKLFFYSFKLKNYWTKKFPKKNFIYKF